MAESPHLNIRYTPRMRLLLELLQAETGLTKAALVQLGLVALARAYELPAPDAPAE